MSTGWIAVDLDRTLAEYHTFNGMDHIGAPIMPMIERVRRWLAKGYDVRIFTARVFLPEVPTVKDFRDRNMAHAAIETFCEEQFGQRLPITCSKDLHCWRIFDDLAVGVRANTGELIGYSNDGLST